jgi:hypothetical protein
MREIEKLNIQNESRKFYQAVKWMTNEYQPRTNSCKDKNGKMTEVDKEVLERWAEHFGNLLNVEGGEEIERSVYVTVEPEVTGPTLEEVEEAARCQRNGRAPGEDQLTAELMKCGGPDLVRYLHRLINEI